MNQKLETFQKNIKRLSELASEWQPEEPCEDGPIPKAFDIEGGTALIWTFHERDTVFIGKCYIPPNAVLPFHNHASKEILVVFEGGGVHESPDVIRQMLPWLGVATVDDLTPKQKAELVCQYYLWSLEATKQASVEVAEVWDVAWQEVSDDFNLV